MKTPDSMPNTAPKQPTDAPQPNSPAKEIGGRGGPDPARYGDWEVGGKCVDF